MCIRKKKNIIIIQPKTGSRHQLVINNKYEKPIEIDTVKDAWGLLLQVGEKNYVQYNPNAHDTLFDYLNTNRRCKLYAKSNYSLTRILEANGGKVVATISVEVISQKSYQQRLNKLHST